MIIGNYDVQFIPLFSQNVRRRIYAQITPGKNDPTGKMVDAAFDATLELIVSLKKDGQDVDKKSLLDIDFKASKPVFEEALNLVKDDHVLYSSLASLILGLNPEEVKATTEAEIKKN